MRTVVKLKIPQSNLLPQQNDFFCVNNLCYVLFNDVVVMTIRESEQVIRRVTFGHFFLILTNETTFPVYTRKRVSLLFSEAITPIGWPPVIRHQRTDLIIWP